MRVFDVFSEVARIFVFFLSAGAEATTWIVASQVLILSRLGSNGTGGCRYLSGRKYQASETSCIEARLLRRTRLLSVLKWDDGT